MGTFSPTALPLGEDLEGIYIGHCRIKIDIVMDEDIG